MHKNIALIAATAGALVLIYSFVGQSSISTSYVPEVRTPHFFGRPDISIERIEIVGIYFVPNDRQSVAIKNWQDILAPSLEKLKTFHELQFLGRSTIEYRFLPSVVVGQERAQSYENTLLSHTDPLSIDPIAREIGARLLDPSGDLWRSLEAFDSITLRRVYLILFEGAGAAGSGDVALISRAYLTDTAYAPYSTTFLAHEFYHTLGLPDAYQSTSYVFDDAQQIQIGLLQSEDIMGRVRVPLEYSYIDRTTLSLLGL